NDVNKNLSITASFHETAKKPWTIITHMFYHKGAWHIIGNMLWLWAFGYILQDLTGSKKVIPIFIYGALAGAFAFIIAYHYVPSLKQTVDYANAVGASAGIMGIAIATTMIAPGYRIFPMLNGGFP